MCAYVGAQPAQHGSGKRRGARWRRHRGARGRQDVPRLPAQMGKPGEQGVGARGAHQLFACAGVLPLGGAREQAAQLFLACGRHAAVMGARAGGRRERRSCTHVSRARHAHRSSFGGRPSACTGAARPPPAAARSCGARARAASGSGAGEEAERRRSSAARRRRGVWGTRPHRAQVAGWRSSKHRSFCAGAGEPGCAAVGDAAESTPTGSVSHAPSPLVLGTDVVTASTPGAPAHASPSASAGVSGAPELPSGPFAATGAARQPPSAPFSSASSSPRSPSSSRAHHCCAIAAEERRRGKCWRLYRLRSEVGFPRRRIVGQLPTGRSSGAAAPLAAQKRASVHSSARRGLFGAIYVRTRQAHLQPSDCIRACRAV